MYIDSPLRPSSKLTRSEAAAHRRRKRRAARKKKRTNTRTETKKKAGEKETEIIKKEKPERGQRTRSEERIPSDGRTARRIPGKSLQQSARWEWFRLKRQAEIWELRQTVEIDSCARPRAHTTIMLNLDDALMALPWRISS